MSVDSRVKTSGIALVSPCNCCINEAEETVDYPVLSSGEFGNEVWRKCSWIFGAPFHNR